MTRERPLVGTFCERVHQTFGSIPMAYSYSRRCRVEQLPVHRACTRLAWRPVPILQIPRDLMFSEVGNQSDKDGSSPQHPGLVLTHTDTD
ncbi:hypothetical protein ElyMa_002519500 [Elysia marginata]|uniref:Uncharacterized protein n=1 Tax=Elysia marginata TaxID=1093978 RepID=A0AAV4GT56_9GAST|nr:hypothetical protein ElyMa_002519500 [Elysia marginata]